MTLDEKKKWWKAKENYLIENVEPIMNSFTQVDDVSFKSSTVTIFSLSNVCSKYAAQHPFLSWEFILLYGASLGILFLYAVLCTPC